jgi:hypothetical protein
VNEHQRSLYERLEGFQIGDPGAALPFAMRLARDNTWSGAFAERVIGEYRRFLFLAVEAGHPVTPSDEVDQAWHLHLLYSESYWTDLCRGLLGRDLHHGPTRGGRDEGSKFTDWYGRTQDSYRRFFGEPPSDIWPPAEIRFGRAVHFRRVNEREHWIISKRAVKRGVTGAGVLSGTLALVGCGVIVAQAGQGNQNWGMSLLIGAGLVLGILWLIFVMKANARRSGHGRRNSGTGAGGCGAFHGGSGCGRSSDDGGGGGSDGGSSGCGGGGCGGGGGD